MASFHLRIVTPESLVYEGEAERIIVRTVQGDVAILPRHIDYLAALGDMAQLVGVHVHMLRGLLQI